MVDNSFGDNSDFVNSSFVKTTYQFKLLIIGECNVGKTSLKIRYTENKFDPNVKPNAGIDFKVKTITVMTWMTNPFVTQIGILHLYRKDCDRDGKKYDTGQALSADLSVCIAFAGRKSTAADL